MYTACLELELLFTEVLYKLYELFSEDYAFSESLESKPLRFEAKYLTGCWAFLICDRSLIEISNAKRFWDLTLIGKQTLGLSRDENFEKTAFVEESQCKLNTWLTGVSAADHAVVRSVAAVVTRTVLLIGPVQAVVVAVASQVKKDALVVGGASANKSDKSARGVRALQDGTWNLANTSPWLAAPQVWDTYRHHRLRTLVRAWDLKLTANKTPLSFYVQNLPSLRNELRCRASFVAPPP